MNVSKLSQPDYLHILINHLPIVGLMVATVLLAVFVVLCNRPAVIGGLIAVALLALSAWPVLITGQKAYEKIDQIADDAGKAYLDRHMQLGETWIYLFVLTSFVAAVGVGLARKHPQLLVPFALATVVLAVACLIAGGVIAENGGMVRHPEFRTGSPPPAEQHLEH